MAARDREQSSELVVVTAKFLTCKNSYRRQNTIVMTFSDESTSCGHNRENTVNVSDAGKIVKVTPECQLFGRRRRAGIGIRKEGRRIVIRPFYFSRRAAILTHCACGPLFACSCVLKKQGTAWEVYYT